MIRAQILSHLSWNRGKWPAAPSCLKERPLCIVRGGIADMCGTGKTVQTMATIYLAPKLGFTEALYKPTLLICPASIVYVWTITRALRWSTSSSFRRRGIKTSLPPYNISCIWCIHWLHTADSCFCHFSLHVIKTVPTNIIYLLQPCLSWTIFSS